MQKIDSDAKTIWELLAGARYALQYYQRDYSWQTKQVTDLIDDLTSKFLANYEEGHSPTQVTNYGHYFLGSIIINSTDGQRFIIDGQQRLTTLTLLLTRLRHMLEDKDLKDQVSTLIYSLNYGDLGFNLDIPERFPIMDAIFSGKDTFDDSDESESVRNIAARYKEIENNLELKREQLPCFVVWLLHKVYLSEITAYADDDAYTIFETMNDRGLSLTPSDMLKGYLLSRIENSQSRINASDVWKGTVEKLKTIGKEEESDAIKAWLRSQHAQNISDFDTIGSKFHRWVREREDTIGLEAGKDFAIFIDRDFKFYCKWYYQLREAANSLTSGLECVFFNSQNNFTLQYPILLAPLCVQDTEKEIMQKIQIVASYLDILIHRRIWNFQDISQRTMADRIFSIIPAIRSQSVNMLSSILYQRIEDETSSFVENKIFHLHGGNRRKIFLILARLTDYMEVHSGKPSRYLDYMKTGKNSYEIEHIWPDSPDLFPNDFPHESEFYAYRNRIGGLLLLPKSENASIGNSLYNEKRNVYSRQNLLAQSLHENAYLNNPGFHRFIERNKLPFKIHKEFKKIDLNDRQELYLKLSELIWNTDRLKTDQETETAYVGQQYGHADNIDTTQVQNSILAEDKLESSNKWTSARIENLVSPERKEFYGKQYPRLKIHECYSMIAELQNLIQEKSWNLTLEFRNYYCAFYSGNSRVFGVNLYNLPRFAVWILKTDAERFGDYCQFDQYDAPHRHAVYPRHTKVETLLPILEFAYSRHK